MHVRCAAVVPSVVCQHLEDAAALRGVRAVLVRAPHVKLLHLGRTDERIAAHLDGLFVAGEYGAQLAQSALDVPGVGQIFVAATLAIEHREDAQIDRLLALVEALPDAARALASAFGWVEPARLRGLTAQLLVGETAAQRWLGIAACALHRVNPGAVLFDAIDQPDARLRARALQAAGELGRTDLLLACTDSLRDDDAACACAAARSAVLLGDRGAAWNALRLLAVAPGPAQMSALSLALFSAGHDAARTLVQELAVLGAPLRTMIKAAGWVGDVQVVPWLLDQMQDDQHARLAGEAFCWLTGVDLARMDLERKPPEGFQAGPSDDPADDNVALDEDESLPWPDTAKLQAWWQAHAYRFVPGQRCLVGAAPSLDHCAQVLKTGYQRQRIAAAQYLCLQQPGTPLFNCAAPAWRQQQLLAGVAG